jgi:predicted kinase
MDNQEPSCDVRPQLTVFLGAPGSGKTTLCQEMFPPQDAFSIDHFEALATGMPHGVTPGDSKYVDGGLFAWDQLLAVVRFRLGRFGGSIAVDACPGTEARSQLLEIASCAEAATVLHRLHVPLRLCQVRDASRPEGHPVGADRVAQVWREVEALSVANLRAEGWGEVRESWPLFRDLVV